MPNTLLLEKRAVADWDEWNSLPESIQNSAVLFKKFIAHPGEGGTPLHKLYRYVRRQRVWFLSLFGLKQDIDFDHLGQK